ncbi:type IV toxin-antitoxin system AbiEi family antitoxin [Chlamydiota bacterium]
MNTEKRTKINKLISNWPKGTVYTAFFLKQLGYNYDLLRFYKKSKWLESVGNGAYKLDGDNIDWFGGIYALQTQLNLDMHVGGKTALELKGHSHYITFKTPKIFLYGVRGEKLPQWFKQYDWDTKVKFVATGLFSTSMPDTLSNYAYRDFKIVISAPERAAMEMLYHVPKEQGFDEAQKIMEGLFTLRPEEVQMLLERCNSIKVKRLFMYIVEKHDFPWVNKLKMDKINFGKGERQIVKQGILNQKYKITVPKKYEV